MPTAPQAVRFIDDERAYLEVSDEVVEAWLAEATAGKEEALEHLFCWAYVTARKYYGLKAQTEHLLTPHEAEELATAFFLEFERAWPRIRIATRFSRRVLQRSLKRFLKRKRDQQRREASIQDASTRYPASTVDGLPGELTLKPWHQWSDEEWHQYQSVLQVLSEANEQTRRIIAHRLKNPPLSYKAIAEKMNLSETAIRMRMSRFYATVRRRYRDVLVKRRPPADGVDRFENGQDHAERP